MATKDYYQILNVHYKADLKTIKSAYRQLALKYHPDHNPENPQALGLFTQIKEAYETLSTLEKRTEYDRTYKAKPETSYQEPMEEETFYEPTSEANSPKRSKPKQGKEGGNLRYNLFISLEEVAHGCERGIRYIRRQEDKKETLQLTLRVPQGAFQHQRLKLTGYGDVTKKRAGDLFVVIHIQNHPLFIKEGLNIRVNVPIHYLDAVLGKTLEVPTLKGIHSLKLKACEFENLQYVLKGQGLPHHTEKERGDLIVNCFMEHPQRLEASHEVALKKCLNTWPPGEMMQEYQLFLESIKMDKTRGDMP